MQTITSPTSPRRRSIWLGVALLAGALTGGAPVPVDAKCALSEQVALRNPVVTVLAGPGDVAVEQERCDEGILKIESGEYTIAERVFGSEDPGHVRAGY